MRVVDVVGGIVLLMLTSPLLLVLMLAVRLGSSGPALYGQERVGQGERLFRCRKLRTMYADTPSVPTHMVGESQVTRLGRWLRRTKLDELPQLLNIIAGEMSFVGPRPCLPTQTELIAERRARGVFSLRPGLTGLAQIRHIDMSDPHRLAEVDAHYLATRTLRGDLEIMVRTLLGGGRRDGVGSSL